MARIDSVKFGEITIGGKTYYSDMAVHPKGEPDFLAKTHKFGMDQLALLLKGGPSVLVIGTGMQGSVRIAASVRQACEDKGIELYDDPTPKAVEMYNGLIAQGMKAAGYFHVTS